MALRSAVKPEAHPRRAWSVMEMGDDRQYAGNHGYADDPRRVYRYDSNVPNFRNVSVDDLLFIRDRERLTGVARVRRIVTKPGFKTMLRCPRCGAKIQERKTMRPRFRCKRGHEFARPRRQREKVTLYDAHYAGTFRAVSGVLPGAVLRQAALRPSGQNAIEEVDPDRFEEALRRVAPAGAAMLKRFNQQRRPQRVGRTLDAHAALETEEETAYAGSTGDTREPVLRTIKARRGREKFRNALIRRYGIGCMVTGCSLLDLLEAAHISPYRSEEDNHVANGLLLRADIHTLFDLNLLAIHPASLKIYLSPDVRELADYAGLHGTRLRTNGRHEPATTPLAKRWQSFTSPGISNPARRRPMQA